MKPCNELEIVGIKSMGRSKDYYAGYDAAVKNDITVFNKIKVEIKQLAENPNFGDLSLGVSCGAMKAIEIIDKYKVESEDFNYEN